MNEKKFYVQRDIYLATTLVTLRFPLMAIDYQTEGDRMVGYFNFEDSPEIREAERKYWQGGLAVEPRTFINNLRGLKAQTSNVYKGPTVDKSQFQAKERLDRRESFNQS